MKIIPKISIRREPAQKPEPGRGTAIQIHTEATHYGMRIYLPVSLDNDGLLNLLSRIPSKAFMLPDNKAITLDFQSRLCTQELLVKILCNIIWRKRIKIAAWLSSNPETLILFRNSGLEISEPELPGRSSEQSEKADRDDKADKADKVDKNENVNVNENSANKIERRQMKVLYNSMRSGDSLITAGDVLLWGHLNAGAEIKAGGNIIIAGKLRGLVHAGQGIKSGSSERVFVMAGSFEARQVRLGRKLCYADENTAGWQKPVLISLEDGLPMIRENKF